MFLERHLRNLLRETKDLVRLTPFDTTTEAGRTRERYRRVTLTGITTGGARFVSLAVVLISVPLTLGQLGTELYGALVTITALTSMLAFADFGLGNGLMTLVASASGHDESVGARRAVSSAFFMLCGISGLLAIPLGVALLVVPWVSFFNLSNSTPETTIFNAVAVFMIVVLINIPLGVVQRVQLAYQRGFLNGAFNIFGSLFGLVVLLVALAEHAELAWIVLAVCCGPFVANVLNGAVLFWRERPDLRPAWSHISRSEIGRLASLGFRFFILQLAAVITAQSGVVIATRVLGPETATDYSVTLRLFMVVPTVVNVLLLPLWPAYAESIGRGDVRFVRRALRASTLLSLVMTGASSIVLVVFGGQIIGAWTNGTVQVGASLLIGMGIWAVLNNGFTSIAMLLNGAGVVTFQVYLAASMVFASVFLSVWLGGALGISGIIWGAILAYLITTAIPTLLLLPRVLNRLGASRRATLRSDRPEVAG